MKKRVFNVVAMLISSIALFGQDVDTAAINPNKRWQKSINSEFADKKTSPLPAKELRRFKGLPFFPIDPAYRVTATLELTPDELFKEGLTTTSRVTRQRIYAYLNFELMGKAFRLPVYQTAETIRMPGYSDYLFFPFHDTTNGEETYIGGRYIGLRIPKVGNTIVLDFNQAYNPYCAYSDEYSCPIVPELNNLDIAVRAGVRYEGH